MSDDYIKRSGILRLFQPTTNPVFNEWYERIKEIPAADVVEVVRCKDCVNWDTDWIPNFGSGHYCQEIDFVTGRDFYCAHGKKKAGRRCCRNERMDFDSGTTAEG